jgi:hypothetical protein
MDAFVINTITSDSMVVQIDPGCSICGFVQSLSFMRRRFMRIRAGVGQFVASLAEEPWCWMEIIAWYSGCVRLITAKFHYLAESYNILATAFQCDRSHVVGQTEGIASSIQPQHLHRS